MDRVGSDVSSSQDAAFIGFLIALINSMTLIWPLARKILTGKHVEYYEKLVWCTSLPHGCYMKYCGGEKRAAAAREREKQARAERRRAAGITQHTAKSISNVMDDRQVATDSVDLKADLVLAVPDKASLVKETDEVHDASGELDALPVPRQAREIAANGEASMDRSTCHTPGAWSVQNGTHVPLFNIERERKMSMLALLERILEEKKVPARTIQMPVPFKALEQMLQSFSILDLNVGELRQILQECDTDKVRVHKVDCGDCMEIGDERPCVLTTSLFSFQDGRVSLADLMEFLRADPHQAPPAATGKFGKRQRVMRASHRDATPCMLARADLPAGWQCGRRLPCFMRLTGPRPNNLSRKTPRARTTAPSLAEPLTWLHSAATSSWLWGRGPAEATAGERSAEPLAPV